MLSPDNTLRDLLAPVAPREFFEHYWERRALLVTGRPERLKGFFDQERFFRAATLAPEPGTPRVRLKCGTTDPRGNHTEISLEPHQIRDFLAAGLTVQADGLDAGDEGLRAFLRALRAELCIASDMDVVGFLSPHDHGYGLHFDAVGIWVLQIEGRKRWWYSARPAVDFPLRNHVPTAEERAREGLDALPLEQAVLEPGDVLYLPAGSWHRARADGHSLHLTVTVRQASPLQLANTAIERRLMELPAWRHLPTALGHVREAGALRAEVEAQFAARLEELKAAVQALTPAALFEVWAERALGVAPAPAAPEPPLERAEVLVRAAALSCALEPEAGGDSKLMLSWNGAVRASLPAHALGFVTRLSEQERFTAGVAQEWNPDYGWDEVEEVLRSLVELGLLRREKAAGGA